MTDTSTDSGVIDALGGNKDVAALFGIEPAAVSQWRKGGIPGNRRGIVAEALKRARIRVPEDFYLRNQPAGTNGRGRPRSAAAT